MKTTLFTLLFCSAAAVAAAASSSGPAANTASDEVTADSQIVAMVQPKYPFEMLREHRPGFVRLDVAVDAKGQVIEVNVLQASQHAFASEAIRAVQKWRFVAADKALAQGHRHVEVPIRFVIAEGVLAQR